MKVIVKMCHSHLAAMILQPELLEQAVLSYQASAPQVTNEGWSGAMDTDVEWEVRDLEKFTALYNDSYVYPSDRSKWYSTVRNGLLKSNES